MSELSEKIVEIKGTESHEELVMVARDNFDMIQRLLERLQTASTTTAAATTSCTYRDLTAIKKLDKIYRNDDTVAIDVRVSLELS